MQFGITIPMRRFLKIKDLPYGAAADNWFCWELHVISLRGRSCLIGVNCATRLSFVLADFRGQEAERLPEIVIEEMKLCFRDWGVPEEKTAGYLRAAGAPELTRTHGRSQVAYLNKAVDLAMELDWAMEEGSRRQPVLNELLNTAPTKCAGDPQKKEPLGRLKFYVGI